MKNNWKVKVLHEDRTIKYSNIEYQIGKILGTGACAKVYRSEKFINQKKQIEDVALRIQNRYFQPNLDLLNKLKDFKWKNTTYPLENIPGGFLYTEYELFQANLTDLDLESIQNNIFKIAKTIAEALFEIHNSKYIHFDVKPDNIVYKINQQQEFKFALCDFSSLQSFENAQRQNLFIEATPQFSPPEIEIQGYSSNVDQSCDIWSLGMSLYTLYSKKYMFTKDNLDQKDKQEFLDYTVDSDIQDEQLKYLIKQTLRVNKEERITAQEMIEYIQNPQKQISQRPRKQSSSSSYTISLSQKQSQDIKYEKVKQPNLITIPILQTLIEDASKIYQNNPNKQDNNNTSTQKKQKQSCLLDIPNFIF